MDEIVVELGLRSKCKGNLIHALKTVQDSSLFPIMLKYSSCFIDSIFFPVTTIHLIFFLERCNIYCSGLGLSVNEGTVK